MQFSEFDQIFDEYDIFEEDRHPYNILSHEVYMVDRDYKIVFANKKKKKKYGEDIIKKKCFEVFPKDKPRTSSCPNCPCAAIFNDKGRKSSRNDRFESIDSKGEIRFVSETAVPLKTNSGERKLALVLSRNVSKRVKLENIKKKFYETLGKDYEDHLILVTNELHKIGYNRVRLYDVVDDCLSPNNPLFVLRAIAGEDGSIGVGYNFHLNDDGYKQVLQHLVDKEMKDEVLIINSLTESRLLRSNEFSPNNKCIKDLRLEGNHWILLPLLAQSKLDSIELNQQITNQKVLVGLLSVDNKGKDGSVTNDDLVLLKDFAEFLGEAIFAIRAEMNLHILNKISELISSKGAKEETHQLIAREVCERMKAGMCSIFIYSDTNQKLDRHANYFSQNVIRGGDFGPDEPEEYDYDSPYLTARSFREGSTLNIFDFAKIFRASDEDKKKFEEKIGKIHRDHVNLYEGYVVKKTGEKRFETHNAVFAPLKFEDHNIGVIRIVNNYYDGRYPFPNSDIDLLKSIALQIAAHTHYEGMKEDLNTAISQISRSIAEGDFDLNEIAKNIVTTIKQMSKAFAVTLFLKDDGQKKLVAIAKEGYPDDFERELEYKLDVNPEEKGIGITAWVAIKGEPFTALSQKQISDCKAHSGNFERDLYPPDKRAKSLIALPMKIADKVIGVLKVEDFEPNKFGRSFGTMFDIMANLASLAIYSIQEIERREELMIVLGHELAAPAAGLASMGITMRNRYSKKEEIFPKDEVLMVNKKKLLNYCGDLIAGSRHLTFITSGRESLDPYTKYKFVFARIDKLIWEVKDVLQPHANWKHLDINFNSEPDWIKLDLDQNKFKQPIYNLLYNAIKYSHKNGIINVILRLDRDNQQVEMKFQDYGIGVPEEDKEVIFYKGKRGRNAPDKDPTGQGLGLYYTRLIIDGHKGNIKLGSLKNPTEFVITLPLKQHRKDSK